MSAVAKSVQPERGQLAGALNKNMDILTQASRKVDKRQQRKRKDKSTMGFKAITE